MLNTKIYFAGSAKLAVDAWLREKKLPRLMSQLNDRNLIPRWVEYQKKVNPDAFIFIDSGAYSAYTKGATIDVDAYIDWLNQYGDSFTVFAQVDFIPGKSNVEQDPEIYLKAPRLSWENYLYMRERLRPELRDKLSPVFHEGEYWEWLTNMLEWIAPDTGKHIPYICISPHTETTSAARLKFCKTAYSIIHKSSNPTVKTHCLGLTALHLLKSIPATSVDSTTWLQTAIHGQILLHKGGRLAPVVVSERTVHLDNHFIYLAPQIQKEIVRQIEALGYSAESILALREKAVPKSQRIQSAEIEDVEDNLEADSLATSISERQMFNALSMQKYLEISEFEGFPKTARRIGG